MYAFLLERTLMKGLKLGLAPQRGLVCPLFIKMRGGRKDGEEGAGRKGSGRGKLEKGVNDVFFSVFERICPRGGIVVGSAEEKTLKNGRSPSSDQSCPISTAHGSRLLGQISCPTTLLSLPSARR